MHSANWSTPKGGYSTTISTFANEFNLHTQLNHNKSILFLNEPNNRKEVKNIIIILKVLKKN